MRSDSQPQSSGAHTIQAPVQDPNQEPMGPNAHECDNPEECYDNDNNQDEFWNPPEDPRVFPPGGGAHPKSVEGTSRRPS